MNTTTFAAELPRRRWHPRRSARLVTAEFLKVRKRRGLVISTLALTVLPMIIAYVVLTILHAADPAKHGPAGGAQNFADSMNFLAGLTGVAAILVGATVGTGDVGAGVFRELVVTGRSRLALFWARVPAGFGLLLLLVGAAFAITATSSTVLAGSLELPSGSLLLHSAGWLALVTALSFALALGISSLLGSRGTSIGILLGWWLVVMPLLLNIGSLGVVREGLLYAAAQRFEPSAVVGDAALVPMSPAAAIVVLLAWTVVPLALGAWRTFTRDA
jgi:ABC-type transport system involved in multi-copper enzyme maturation permease subunit